MKFYEIFIILFVIIASFVFVTVGWKLKTYFNYKFAYQGYIIENQIKPLERRIEILENKVRILEERK